MRARALLTMLTLALTPALAWARQNEASATPAATGSVDFGVRGTSLDGDGARYERYRDLGDGLFLETLRYERQQHGWVLSFAGDHLGRLDQRLTGRAVRPGKVKGWMRWDQIPMLLSRTTQTLFIEETPGVLRVPDLIQTQVQATPALITTMVSQFDRPFEMKTRRHIAEGGLEYLARPDLTFRVNARNIDRKGAIPFGGSFGHGSFVETPAPVRYDITDTDGSVEYAQGNALVRAGYTFSWFHNDVTSLLFENPYRATDVANGSSLGRIALPPTNSWLGVNGMVSYRLPHRTRALAYVSTNVLKDAGDSIIPFTANTALPVLALDRPTVEGSARTTNVNLALTSRPSDYLSIDVRFKSYDYDNRTPVFTIGQRVAYDASLSAANVARAETEPFGVQRHTFDADLKYMPRPGTAAGIGFSRIAEDRNHRIFHSTDDNIVRAVFDAVGTSWFSVRTKFEHAERRGTGIEEGELELIAINEQPKLRHFDIADRDRNRVTFIGTAAPASNVAFNVSVASGRDDYLNSIFGLLDNKHRVYAFGVDTTPSERVVLGVSYSYEDYRALSRSRQASNAAQQADVTRNWSTDGHDRVHSVIANAEFLKIANRLDVRLSYDFNRARAFYTYDTGPIADRTLPEETEVIASTLPEPTQLPPALSETKRGTFDLAYAITEKLGLGFTYWRDQYTVSDFTLDAQANPTLDRGNALLIGYIYRPYTANTFWGRVTVGW